MVDDSSYRLQMMVGVIGKRLFGAWVIDIKESLFKYGCGKVEFIKGRIRQKESSFGSGDVEKVTATGLRVENHCQSRSISI